MCKLIVSVPDHCLSFYSDQTGRSGSSLGAQPVCWFCRVAAHISLPAQSIRTLLSEANCSLQDYCPRDIKDLNWTGVNT